MDVDISYCFSFLVGVMNVLVTKSMHPNMKFTMLTILLTLVVLRAFVLYCYGHYP